MPFSKFLGSTNRQSVEAHMEMLRTEHAIGNRPFVSLSRAGSSASIAYNAMVGRGGGCQSPHLSEIWTMNGTVISKLQ